MHLRIIRYVMKICLRENIFCKIQAGNVANEFNGPLKTLLIDISLPFWNTGGSGYWRP
jgi:hypothetical protein